MGWQDKERTVGHSECAGINRHVVGDERALRKGGQRIPPGLESCGAHRTGRDPRYSTRFARRTGATTVNRCRTALPGR
jgi:hypothetical protein